VYTIPADLKKMVDKDSDFDVMAFDDIFKIAHALSIILIYIWVNYKVYKSCKLKKFYFAVTVFWAVVLFTFFKARIVDSCKYLDIDLDTYYDYYNPVMKD
jgi:hypothetical protein